MKPSLERGSFEQQREKEFFKKMTPSLGADSGIRAEQLTAFVQRGRPEMASLFTFRESKKIADKLEGLYGEKIIKKPEDLTHVLSVAEFALKDPPLEYKELAEATLAITEELDTSERSTDSACAWLYIASTYIINPDEISEAYWSNEQQNQLAGLG